MNPHDFKPGDKFRVTTVDPDDHMTTTIITEGTVGEVRTDRILVAGSLDSLLFESPTRTWELVERPAPAEPTGVGDVVEYTAGGTRYVAVRTDEGEWLDEFDKETRGWMGLIRDAEDVTVMFEGRP